MNVNWSELIACYGSATAEKVPAAIELLFTGNAEQREKAYWKIDNHMVVQGSLYESAPYAARLIVDRIKAGHVQFNVELLDLLFELVNGDAGGAKVEHGPLKGQPIRKLCRDTIGEILPAILNARKHANGRERMTIDDIWESYAHSDVE